MADQTPLGNLDVIISADWSDLQSEVNAAVAASQTAADTIEAAFNGIDTSEAVAAIGLLGGAAQSATEDLGTLGQAAQDSTGGVDALGGAADPLAGSLNDVGGAAQSAGGDLGGFASDANTAAGSAHEAEGGVAGLAEQFVALGEALAATEALKEFGQEALTAYGTVQSVTIGLTQLTGSAEQADTIIEQIKELAATEPFAFPEIAPTIQKMVALGVSAEQIPGVMQAVADAAAATGNQFSQVANSFDRMTLSGTVSARSLVQLGVNTTQLGQAMGVAADQVKAAFLAMDQSQRITVLEAAMQKFAGAAEAQAQGIAGQWQIFQNQFEEVMVGVGEALAPVVGDILAFGKTVLSEVQTAIAAFNELPAPVKDVVVVIGLLAAAIVPVTAGIAALGFGWIGLQSAGAALTAIVGALSVETGVLAAEEGTAATAALAEAAATSTLAAASAEAAGAAGVGGLAAALGILGGTVLPAAIGAIIGFSAATVKDLYLPTDNINTFNEEMGAFTQDVSAGTTEVNAFGGAIPGLTANVQTLGGAVTDVSGSLQTLLEPLTAVTAKQMSANTAFGQASVAVQLAKVALKNAQDQYDGTSQSAASLSLAHQVLTRAVVNLDSATQAATPHGKNYGDTIAGVTQNLQLAQEKFQSLLSVFSTVNAAVANGTGSVNLQAEAYTKLESAAKASGNSFASYQGILAQVTVATNQAYAAYGQLGAAYGTLLDLQKSGVDVTAQLADVYKQWEAAGTKVGIAVTTIAGQMALFTAAAEKQTTTLTDNVGAFAKFAAIQQPTVTQVDATKAAFEAITTEAASMGIEFTKTATGFGFVATAGTNATPALQAFIDKLNGILGATGPLVDVNGKWVQSMAALPAWLQSLVQGLEKQAGAAKDATAATQAHTGAMSDNAAMAARAQQAQIDLGSTYQTVANTITQLTNAGKNQVTTLENLVGAFTSLNSYAQTTISGQLALQDALKGAQTAGSALGITITNIGASTNSTNPAVIALTKSINDEIAAANTGANQNQNYIGSLNGIANAANNATGAIKSLAAAENASGKWLENGGQGGSMVGEGMGNTSAADYLSMLAAMGAPADVIDQAATAMGYVQVGNNDFITRQEYVDQYNAANKGGNQMTWVDNGSPGGAFQLTGPSGSSATSATSSSTTAAASTAAASIANLGIAAAGAATPLGNATVSIANFGTAISTASASAQATIPVMQALLTTSDSAATEISKFGTNASELTTAQQNYESSVADATNAQDAYTNAVLAGTDSQAQLQQLYAAAQSADAAMLNQVGTASVQATQALTTTANTSLTAADELKGLGINASELTSAQQSYYAAVAASTNAQNAFSNALNSGTASAAQLTALLQASYAAQEAVNNATGSASVGNANQSSSSQTVNMQAQPSEPPSGLTPMQIATGAWIPDYSKGTWVWTEGVTGVGGAVGSSNNYAGAASGPGEPIGPALVPGASSGVNLTININAGTVVGQNAAQQLTNLVMPQVVSQLRQAGVKI